MWKWDLVYQYWGWGLSAYFPKEETFPAVEAASSSTAPVKQRQQGKAPKMLIKCLANNQVGECPEAKESKAFAWLAVGQFLGCNFSNIRRWKSLVQLWVWPGKGVRKGRHKYEDNPKFAMGFLLKWCFSTLSYPCCSNTKFCARHTGGKS